MQLFVHNLPQLIEPSELAGSVVVVVDQLRASSTICQALAAGARGVVPLVEIDGTLERASSYARSEIVLGGERGGRRIEGFDLGNSPTEYTPERVAGRTVLFTTTNGARALSHAHQARRVLVGATVNRGAIVAELLGSSRVDILCAGTDGQITGEDILAAGAIVDGLCLRSSDSLETNEAADAARLAWRELLAAAHALGRSASDQFARQLPETAGGKNLLAIGHEFDLEVCARLDALDVAPELDLASGVIAWRET
jgi:2-phosphosulfolactate phosphatase